MNFAGSVMTAAFAHHPLPIQDEKVYLGSALYECAICPCPPIHCKARRDRFTLESPNNREKIQESALSFG